MDCSLLYVPQFFYIFLILFAFYLVLSNYLLFVLLLFSVISEVFSFLTGLSYLLGPSGFWLLALPVGVCSLECNNSNNNLSIQMSFTHAYQQR